LEIAPPEFSRPSSFFLSADSGPPVGVLGVGHPVKPLADMGRARARSAQIGGPDGISQTFQVNTYSSEPFTSSLALNLFSKDDWRMALGDEPMKSGP